MLELVAMFLIVVGAVSTIMGFSASMFIYSFLLMSILIVMVGAVRGGEPKVVERNVS